MALIPCTDPNCTICGPFEDERPRYRVRVGMRPSTKRKYEKAMREKKGKRMPLMHTTMYPRSCERVS